MSKNKTVLQCNNTRRYPRTLTEAFGAYTSAEFYEPPPAFEWADALVFVVSGTIGLGLMALLVLGVM